MISNICCSLAIHIAAADEIQSQVKPSSPANVRGRGMQTRFSAHLFSYVMAFKTFSIYGPYLVYSKSQWLHVNPSHNIDQTTQP